MKGSSVYAGWYKSNPEPWAASSRLTFNLGFLDRARKDFEFPVVDSMRIRFFDAAITTTTDAFEGRKFLRIFERVDVDTAHGDKIDASPFAYLAWLQWASGNRYRFPADLADGVAHTDLEFVFPLIFEVPRLQRRGDTAVWVPDLLDGHFRLHVADATPAEAATTVVSGTIELWAHVREGKREESLCNLIVETQAVQQAEYSQYRVNGSLLYAALLYADETDGDYGSVAASWDEIDSEDLGLVDHPRSLLKDRYLEQSPTHDETHDLVANDLAIPLYTPDEDALISELPDLSHLHIKLPDAPGNAMELVTAVVRDRSPQRSAAAHGYTDVRMFQAAVASRGYVKGADGRHIPAVEMPREIVSRLPIRLARR